MSPASPAFPWITARRPACCRPDRCAKWLPRPPALRAKPTNGLTANPVRPLGRRITWCPMSPERRARPTRRSRPRPFSSRVPRMSPTSPATTCPTTPHRSSANHPTLTANAPHPPGCTGTWSSGQGHDDEAACQPRFFASASATSVCSSRQEAWKRETPSASNAWKASTMSMPTACRLSITCCASP